MTKGQKALENIDKTIVSIRCYEKVNISDDIDKDIKIIEKELKALALLKPLFKEGSLKAGQYIDWDNPCIMVKDTKTDSVINWYRCSEDSVDLLNEVMNCD